MPRDHVHPAPGIGRTLAGVALLAVVLGAAAGAEREQQRQVVERKAADLTGGDPRNGRRLAQRMGCGGCHEIPRVPGAHGRVGPPLDGFATRAYVAGVRENTPTNLEDWLQDPRAVDPQTAMPNVGLDERQARDVAAFLYTLD